MADLFSLLDAATGDNDALQPLRERYDAEHYRLVKFYYECSNLRYLTSLITIPKLPGDPPNLLADEGSAPKLPARPKQEIEQAPSPPPAAPKSDEPDDMSEFWKTELERQNQEFADQQRVLEERAQQQAMMQQQAAMQAQREFEEQQRLLAEQQRREQEALAAQQSQWQTQGQLAELQRENLNARAQYERDQLLLQQYDARVKALENELQQQQLNAGRQQGAKDDQIKALQEQVNTWRSKYEALAKLYAQLRHEHLDLLQKFKQVQLKAASAQEAVDRREKLERELKTKNLELADMIRERDRALHDRDRVKGSSKDDTERLKRDLRLAQERADNLEKAKGNELSTMVSKYHRELADLEEALRQKAQALEQARGEARHGSSDLERALREKDDELAVYKAGLDQALEEMEVLKEGQSADVEIDSLVVGKLDDLVDAVLDAAATRVDDSLYELDSTLHAGNPSAMPPYLLSQVEKASSAAMECATSFNNYIADGANTAPTALAELPKNISTLASAVADMVPSVKGIARRTADDDKLEGAARSAAQATARFFRSLQSWRLDGLDALQKTDVVINGNNDVQLALQALNRLVDVLPRGFTLGKSGDPSAIVEQELAKAMKAVQAAAARLAALRNKPRDPFAAYEVKVHEAILDAAAAVTSAVAELVRAATSAQNDIVQAGRGASSRTAFYKKNNRWTEGLISAAKAVAAATNTLIETADGVLSGRNSPEQLIVASNDVAASTAQLVAASRVRAVGGIASRTQEGLEVASKAVGGACRALVRQVQALLRPSAEDAVDYSKLGAHEFKVREMEQQVEILQLENALSAARSRLGEMRKISYQEE